MDLGVPECKMLSLIKNCAVLSKQAYLEPTDINLDSFSFSFISNKAKDTELYAIKKQDTLYIVFRGTEINSRQDRFTDYLFFPYSPCPLNNKIKVHRGFYNSFKSIELELTNYIFSARPSKIIFTGHSLGGALALLSSYFLSKTLFHTNKFIKSVITFGAPKVGNKYFVADYKQQYFYNSILCVVNNSDIVPQLPLFFYQPVGNIIYINRFGTKHFFGYPKWVIFDQLISMVKHRFDSISDHNIDNYIMAFNEQ